MTEMPEMPKDFWPASMLVIGKHEGIELGFAITDKCFLNVYGSERIEGMINALRQSLWQAAHLPPEERAKL